MVILISHPNAGQIVRTGISKMEVIDEVLGPDGVFRPIADQFVYTGKKIVKPNQKGIRNFLTKQGKALYTLLKNHQKAAAAIGVVTAVLAVCGISVSSTNKKSPFPYGMNRPYTDNPYIYYNNNPYGNYNHDVNNELYKYEFDPNERMRANI